VRPTISALAHPVVRKCCGGVFMLMASAAIPVAFVDGTHLSRGALPYFLGALIASAAIFALSSAASRRVAKLRRLIAPVALADEFSDWVLAKRAALPGWPSGASGPFGVFGGRFRGALPSDSPELARYNATRDEVQRHAREEYHEQFRKQVMTIVGPDKASSPQTIPELEELAGMVRAYATHDASRRDWP